MKQFLLLLMLCPAFYAGAQHSDRAAVSDLAMQASNLRSDTVDILNYQINLNITDFVGNTISGNTAVKFTPKMNGVNVLNLDLLMLTVDSVEVSGANLTYSYNDTLLSINLPAAYLVGDTITTTIYYHGPPQGDASGWGGFYFQSGYAYNLGVGFAAIPHNYGRVWFPCFDNFVERSTYDFNITTNAGKIAYCNGYLASDTTDGSGNRTRRWIMNSQIPSYLASVSVAAYTEINQSYTGLSGTVPIKIAALPSDTTNVKNSFVNLPLALSTFEGHFGPYVWNRVGYCMVPFSSGAMEHATNISYPRLAANGTLTYQNLYAHELSHHWFGDLATCRTAEDMWLNEGWAHYCEFLFYEALSGHTAYLNSVRANHSDNLQFNHVKEGGYQSLSNIPLQYTYGDHVYNRGADVAHTLRSYLGDSLFFYSVKTYLSNNHFKDVSSADFRDALTAASGVDMTDFFNDWVFNPGWPHFSIDSVTVVPAGPDFNVTVFVKQKITGAPSYFTNVPLEVTFKASNWTEQTKSFVMSGPTASFNFTIPFNPAFVALNMGEKISHAVAPDVKILKAATTYNFNNAKFVVVVQAITDSAFMRIEHNFAAPDPYQHCCIPYRLSPNHYWKVDGILPPGFKARAQLNYDGRTTSFAGNMWLDDQLINADEDSLVLMYRANTADEWHVYPYYTKNTLGNNTDKRGIVNIDTLLLGEYVYAMKDYTMGVGDHGVKEKDKITIFPNPAKDVVTVDASLLKISNDALLIVTDVSGRVVSDEKIRGRSAVTLQTGGYRDGIYFVTIRDKGLVRANGKFVVSH